MKVMINMDLIKVLYFANPTACGAEIHRLGNNKNGVNFKELNTITY